MAGGKKRFYDNRVCALSTVGEGGKTAVYATVKGNRDYKTKILFDEQGGLYDYTCDCEVFQNTDGPCRHIVAAALAYENKYPSSPVESGVKVQRSDTGVHTLIERFGKQRYARRIAEEGEKVKLQPCVMLASGGRVSLKFTIGNKKMYTLKSVSDFVSCLNTGAEKRYGVELTVMHVPEAFDELSGKLAKFICGCWREKNEFLQDANAEQWGYRDELPLSAGSVDEFMALYAGQLVPCGAQAVQDSVRLIVPQENALSPHFRLEKVTGGYVLTSGILRPQIVFGRAYKYILTDSRIFRVTDAYCDAVLPLIKAIEARARLFIAEGDMPQFYNSVLARVIPFAEVDAPDIDLSVFEAAPLELRMYLNVGLGGGIEAKLFASYDGETNIDILDDNTPAPFVRDYEGERAFIAVLRKYFPYFPDLSVDAEEDVYALLRSGLREMMGHAEIYLSEELKRMKVKKPPRIRVGVRLKSELLSLDLSAEGYDTEELKAVLEAYRSKKSYVRLTDGSFVDLVDSSIAALSSIAEAAQVNGSELTLPAYYAPYVDSELKNAFFVLERSDTFKKMIADLANAHDSLTEVPESLRQVMRNYQKAGFRWLKALTKLGYGGILADDMGLGKSLQIIALLLSEKKGTSMIVCPTTLVLNWVNEFSKFAPELKVLAVSGTGDERKSLVDEFPQYDVVITSYELLRRDIEAYKAFGFSFVVIDEAQYIKNHETKNAQAVKQLKAEHRFALTGTPVENSLSELWSIFDFLMPGYLFSYPHFRDTLESEIVRGGEAAAERLSRLIKPFILRRLKAGVLKELPPKMESEVLCTLAGEQKKLYGATLGLIKESVESAGKSVNKVVVLSMLTKLRQICCEPQLVYPDYAGNSEKLNTCLELVRSATEAGHKVLIFSQFTSMLEILRKRLNEAEITHYLLKGDTPKAERIKLVSRFNTDKTQVFLISLKAGGTGLNLTGADVVIHYDPWWNESVMNQATDRAYRIGQDKSVQIYKLIMQGSIEQQIVKLQSRKNALSGLVMNSASGGVNLSYEDILALLSE